MLPTELTRLVSFWSLKTYTFDAKTSVHSRPPRTSVCPTENCLKQTKCKNCIIVINNRNFIEEEELVKLWRKWQATQNLVFITQWSMRRLQDYEKSSSRKYERLWFLFTSENSTWTSSTGTGRPEEPVRVDEVDIWSWSSFGFSIFWKTTKHGYEIWRRTKFHQSVQSSSIAIYETFTSFWARIYMFLALNQTL